MEALYTEKYVSFIDLLGFSNLVLASEGDAGERRRIINAIERLKDTGCNNPWTGQQITYFSDCLVISANRTPEGLSSIIGTIITIAENLLVVDVLIRGGLTIGLMHHDEQFMFGPGMLEAYDMESRQAKNPSVLVSEKVVEDIEAAEWLHVLYRDTDGRHFLHYLVNASFYDAIAKPGVMVWDEPANLIRHFIARRIDKDEGSTLAKAEWLEDYWNRTVGSAGVLGVIDRETDLIPPENPAIFRSVRRIVSGDDES